MRLWSLHPQYLDRQGLLALWREGLLAQKVLEGRTKGYKHHPQLLRFKEFKSPLKAMGIYLTAVYVEAVNRGYSFEKSKIKYFRLANQKTKILKVTTGQLKYEWFHLLKKLKKRTPDKFALLKNKIRFDCHPLFMKTKGKIEPWEIL